MIHTFKHAHNNFKETRAKKIANGDVITFSQLNLWKILDLLEDSDVTYVSQNMDARIYYICKPLKSHGKHLKKNWNELLTFRYQSEITDYENRAMEQTCGVSKNFNHETFKFVL
jgi:hypothetical protein